MTYIEFKKGAKHAKKGADISDTTDAFEDCGYLLKQDDVVIDIDHVSKDTIMNMIEYFNIKTQTVWTDRGAHLYFKKPLGLGRARNGNCALGFEIEMKNANNTPNGLTVKRNGVARKMDNEGIFQELPWFLQGSPKYKVLYGMGDGDGRNNALYSHKMSLNNHDGWQSVLSFVNRYIFAEPMNDKEFDAVSRKEAVDTKSMTQYKIAERIINDYKCVEYMGDIWWYNMKDDEYIHDPDNKTLKKLVYEICGEVDTRFVDEVIKQIAYRSKKYNAEEAFTIKFANGALTPEGMWVDSYDEFTPYKIAIDYRPDAEPVAIVDSYIDNLTDGDEEYRMALMEALAFVLVTDPEKIRALGKFWIFRGEGRNGKGTLLQVMKKIYNAKNCTSLSIKQLADPRYNVTMIGKLANLGDDIEGDAIDNQQMKMLKNIVTADSVSSRQLYKQSMTVTFTTKLYFTTNNEVKSYEKGYAYQRRVVWMPMYNKIDKPDPQFITKITTPEALEYWIRLLMEGYKRLMVNGAWTSSEVIEKFNSEYHEANNQMERFALDMKDDIKEVFVGKTVNEVKGTFDDWADDDTLKFNSKLLKDALWKHYQIGLGRLKRDGRTIRGFMKQDDTNQDLRPK